MSCFNKSLLSFAVMVGCGTEAADDPTPTGVIELAPATTSALIQCEDSEAEFVLHVIVSALPNWEGHHWRFPLKRPGLTEHGLGARGYVCSIGSGGFYGWVDPKDATNKDIGLDIKLTYDHDSLDSNSFERAFRIPRSEEGELEFHGNWLVEWKWESVGQQNGITKP
ncbi:MAG: hypothetical protein ABJZ55_15580 [Fuerstiella sp.]